MAKILLIEDHEDTAAVTAKLLRQEGHDVQIAHTCRGAFLAAFSASFDLLIADLSLPDGDGHELVAEIQVARRIPALAVTGRGARAVVNPGLPATFCEYLTKPISFTSLLAAVDRCLTRNGP